MEIATNGYLNPYISINVIIECAIIMMCFHHC